MKFPWQHINSEQFLVAFLLFCVFCYMLNLISHDARKKVLIAVSLIVIGYIDFWSLLYLLAISHISYYMIQYKNHSRKLYRLAFVFISILMSYKFLQVAFLHSSTSYTIVLLGISYFTFRITATLFDSARGALKQVCYIDYLHYCLFFPIFIGGPVQRYNLFAEVEGPFSKEVLYGLMRIFRGCVKKILLADTVMAFFIVWVKSSALHNTYFSVNTFQWPMSSVKLFSSGEAVLLFGFLCIIRAYFDLSALTDIAIGISQCFGYRISENFNKPLLSLNIIEFWRRWHMTIANWARDYVFSPFLLKTRNIFVAVFSTMICVGLWHQPSWRWLFWGIGHGVGLVVCGAWQRTGASRWLQSTKKGLLCRQYNLMLPNIIKLAKERNFSFLYRMQFSDALSLPSYSAIRINITWFMTFFLRFIFNVPAWLLNFGYMSFIFIAVSCPTTAQAIKMYSILFGFGK